MDDPHVLFSTTLTNVLVMHMTYMGNFHTTPTNTEILFVIQDKTEIELPPKKWTLRKDKFL